MARSELEIEELFGRQYALESMLTHLIWTWVRQQPHPPSALSEYLRPIEQGMASISASQPSENAAMSAAQETVKQIGRELERTLQRAALHRADDAGPVQ